MANQMSVLSAKRIRAQFVRQSLGKALFYAAIYAFLLVMAVIVLFPFYWMLISSVKTLDEYRLSVPTFWPRVLMLNNYISAFTTAKLGQAVHQHHDRGRGIHPAFAGDHHPDGLRLRPPGV